MKDAGYTIACAIANVVFAVDVCGIAQAILETIGAAKEIISDVVGFIKDLGGAIGDFLGLGGSDGPPLWQVVFNQYLKPNIGAYAEHWFEEPKKFAVEFDVSGTQSQSLVCTIAQKAFGQSCAWLFGPDQMFVPLFRGDTIKAIKMAQAAAVTQAIATLGKKAQEWLAFRHDWTTTRAPADRLRKAYGVWGSARDPPEVPPGGRALEAVPRRRLPAGGETRGVEGAGEYRVHLSVDDPVLRGLRGGVEPEEARGLRRRRDPDGNGAQARLQSRGVVDDLQVERDGGRVDEVPAARRPRVRDARPEDADGRGKHRPEGAREDRADAREAAWDAGGAVAEVDRGGPRIRAATKRGRSRSGIPWFARHQACRVAWKGR